MERHSRIDSGTLQKATRTPQGGLRVPAYLTRVGVFTYRTTDGKTQKEFRSHEEVFHADSLASLVDATVTKLHPPSMVKADNWKDFAAGHVGETVKADGDFVSADLIVQDAKVCEAIEKRDLCEISCGYSCDVDYTPGEYKGEKYDAVQRNIKYNHAALGPKNWGRAGNDVRLRLDSGDAVMVNDSKKPVSGGRKNKMSIAKITLSEKHDSITIDGVPYSLKGDGATQAKIALDAACARMKANRLDLDEAGAKSALEELQTAFSEMHSLIMKLGVAVTNAAPAAPAPPVEGAEVDPETLDSLVDQRLALRTRITKLAPTVKHDGKKDAELIKEVVAARKPEIKLDGLSDDRLLGIFEGLEEKPADGTTRNDSLDKVRAGAANPPGVEKNDAEEAYNRNVTRLATRWQDKTA